MSILSQLWWSGVHAVGGQSSVRYALQQSRTPEATEILAIGKAAASMCAGALAVLPSNTPALVVTKAGHAKNLKAVNPQVEVIEAGHPIPDEQSLFAGQRLYERIRACEAGSVLLLLISGGASALAERLPPGMSLRNWQAKTHALVGSGADIASINAERSKLSLIKSGRLLKAFGGQQVKILAISDVEGDSLAVIGSGLGDPKYLNCAVESQIVASNATARAAIVAAARSQGLAVVENQETLYQDVFVVAKSMAESIRKGPAGLYLWGGEPTIELPVHPGRGGRNQSLALALAREFSKPLSGPQGNSARDQSKVEVLVAGTDGTDGPTTAAGGWLRDAGNLDPLELSRVLDAADAGTFLASRDELFVTGPTDTNVMDLVLCLKR